MTTMTAITTIFTIQPKNVNSNNNFFLQIHCARVTKWCRIHHDRFDRANAAWSPPNGEAEFIFCKYDNFRFVFANSQWPIDVARLNFETWNREWRANKYHYSHIISNKSTFERSSLLLLLFPCSRHAYFTNIIII